MSSNNLIKDSDANEGRSVSENSTDISSSWNDNEEHHLKAISERANCMDS